MHFSLKPPDSILNVGTAAHPSKPLLTTEVVTRELPPFKTHLSGLTQGPNIKKILFFALPDSVFCDSKWNQCLVMPRCDIHSKKVLSVPIKRNLYLQSTD